MERITSEYVLSHYQAGQRDFQYIRLTDVDLQGQQLDNIDLSYADLEGARLRGASLRFATFFQANLRKADLAGAILNGADFQGANLWLAILSDAVVQGVNLSGANLRDTQLINIRGVPNDRRLALVDFETCMKSRWSPADVAAWRDAGTEFSYSANFEESFRRILFQKS